MTYVATELGRLERLRRELSEAESRHEATCIVREMELNRVQANLEARSVALDRLGRELRDAENAAQSKEQKLQATAADLARRELVVYEQQANRAKLEAEAAELARVVSELRPLADRLEARQREAEKHWAELQTKQERLDRGLAEVARTELALQKRLTEIDELEESLQNELESRAAQLAEERRMLLEEIHDHRTRSAARSSEDNSDFGKPT